MKQNELSALALALSSSHQGSLGDLSANDQGERCLNAQLSCASLEAVWFDKVKEDWYNKQYFHQVRSADALYKHGNRYYLIEFKTGKPENLDIHRKLYDSIIGLLEHRVLSLSDCRENLQYIVVSLKYDRFPQHGEMMDHFNFGVSEPWEYSVTRQNLNAWDKNDVRKLSGFLVNKVYKLCPADFETFVCNRNWSN